MGCGAMDMIKRIVEEFNKYRSPEAVTKLVSFDGNSIVVEFMGCFCHTCGVYDYVDDFRIMLEDAGIKTVVEKIKEVDNGLSAVFVVK